MAPVRSKKRASSGVITPPKQPRTFTISLAQKQALIDNLQLEVTSRARKLRAQYALQAQGLRTRIEIRVNRIPLSLRKVNMGDLLEKYAAEAEAKRMAATKTSSTKPTSTVAKAAQRQTTARRSKKSAETDADIQKRGTKRSSDDVESLADKENTPQYGLTVAKKRAKTTTASTAATRATSRAKASPAQVLSPKSSNSRSLPHSPDRVPPSPSKSTLLRPTSPLKPAAAAASHAGARTTRAIAGMVEKAKSTRAKAARKRSPTTKPTTTTSSKNIRAPAKPPSEAAAKKKVTTKKTESQAAPERRVLRKRAP